MRFLSSSGIEDKIKQKDLEKSRENNVKKNITQTKEWKDHAKHCDIAEVDSVSMGRETFEFAEEKRTLTSPLESEKPSEEKTLDEQRKIHQTQHQPAQLMGNEMYFGVMGGRKVMAGCACGEEIGVTASLQVDYIKTETAAEGPTKSLYGSKDELELTKTESTYTQGFSWEEKKKKGSLYS